MLLACILQVDAVNFNTSENSDRKLSKVIHYKKYVKPTGRTETMVMIRSVVR